MYILKKILYIVSLLKVVYKPKLLILPLTSGIITYLCVLRGFELDMRIGVSFFFIGTFFVFSVVMNTVNTRRLDAINEIYDIKSYILSIFETASVQKVVKKQDIKEACKILMGVKNFLKSELDDDMEKHLLYIDNKIQLLAYLGERMREKGLSAPEVSRIQQQIAQIRNSFERLVSIKENRSPQSLKLFIYLSIPTSTIILAPAFATLGFFGVTLAILVAFLLSLLLVIQNDLEDPFNDDIDDVHLDFLERFEKRLSSLK